MMIDFAVETEREQGMSAAESIVHAAHIRFRPIMMTTVAALAGTLPIALALGAGAETRRPLGIAVVGGLAFSQVTTLYVTPVLYTCMDSLNRWIERKMRRKDREQSGAGGQLELLPTHGRMTHDGGHSAQVAD